MKIPLLAASMGVSLSLFAAPLHFSLSDTAGKTHTAAEWRGGRAVVLYFITTDCPISNSYVPEMNRIAGDYAARGVLFYGVIADNTIPIADIRKHVHDFSYTFPVLLDPRQELVKLTGADTTPEAVLLSPGGQKRYLGRIDNRVEGFGQQRPAATEHYLRNGLDEVLGGKTVAKAFVAPIGCSIVKLN